MDFYLVAIQYGKNNKGHKLRPSVARDQTL